MNFKIAPDKEPQSLFLLCLFAFLELFFSGLVTLLITPDPKNALLFGFSAQRLLLVAGIWIFAIIVLGSGVIARKKKLSLDSAWLVNKKKTLRLPIYAISFVLILWGWLSLFCPPYLFGRQIYIFERLQPFSIALGLIMAQSWLFFLFARGRLAFRVPARSAFRKYFRPILLFAAIIFSLGIFMAFTKFGLLTSLVFANVPGIPLSGLQLFFILLLVGLWIAFGFDQEQHDQSFLKVVKRYHLIPILIFITAVLVWGLTPMSKNYFSLVPAAPSYQPFPYSDARFYDLGGISILQGFGIFFHQSAEKPLYMVFMGFLHLLAGSNYTIMTWLQILVLALIPVIFFYLGVKFHGTALGIFMSLVLIIRQRNALPLSYKISSVNPKLFMTEEMTLLGVALIAYLVFMWVRDRKIWQAILCGGFIGAASLIRLNPLFLFPAAAVLIVPVFWKMGKKILFRQLSVFTLAFLILLIPWVFSTVNAQGTPWLWIKYYLTINQRYGSINSSTQGYQGNNGLDEMERAVIRMEETATPIIKSNSEQAQPTNDNTQGTATQNTPGVLLTANNASDGIAYRLLFHFLHNFSASILSMPDSLVYDDTNHLSQRIYWIDGGGWRGDLPVTQVVLIFLNLALIAIGLGYSWIHHRWAGLVPLVIFIGYSLGLSAAMNSGGRYLTPMDWVPYFYYGLAFVVIVHFIRKVLTKKVQSQLPGSDSDKVQPIPVRRGLGFSLAAIIFLASLIPISNFVPPLLTGSTRNQADVEVARESISAKASPGASIVFGEIHYPYYADGRLTIYFVTSKGPAFYILPKGPPLETELRGGERAFIALRNNVQGNPQVESIYLWQSADPVLIWRLQN